MKYAVTYYETWERVIHVEADNAEDARQLADANTDVNLGTFEYVEIDEVVVEEVK